MGCFFRGGGGGGFFVCLGGFWGGGFFFNLKQKTSQDKEVEISNSLCINVYHWTAAFMQNSPGSKNKRSGYI